MPNDASKTTTADRGRRKPWDNPYNRVTVRFSPSMLGSLQSWWQKSGAEGHMLSGLRPLIDRALACPDDELEQAAMWWPPHIAGMPGRYCNVCLPPETWVEIEAYQRRFNVPQMATAVKQLLRLGLGEPLASGRGRTADVVVHLFETTDASQSEIARRLGISRQCVNWTLNRATS